MQEGHKHLNFSEEEAAVAFEQIAQRLDVLIQKEKLTPQEEKEMELLFNNGMVIQDILDKKPAKEFS